LIIVYSIACHSKSSEYLRLYLKSF